MTKRRYRFIVVPACTDLNRGDQALVWESANLLSDAFGPATEIDIVDYGNTPEERARQSEQTKAAGYSVIKNIVENPKRTVSKNQKHLTLASYLKVALTALMDFSRQLILVVFPYCFTAKVTLRHKDQIDSFKALRDADGCVVKGGGFVHTYGQLQDPYYLWFNLYYVILALRLRKKVIFFPNSFGPIKGTVNRLILKLVLNRCSLVYTREKVSQKCLEDIGCKNILPNIDLAYYCEALKNPTFPGEIQNSGKPKIGVTVRPYRFPESEDPQRSYADYVRAIAEFCDSQLEFEFYFIVQVQGPSAHEDDRIAISDVINLSGRSDLQVIDGNYDYRDLIAAYSKMDFVVGTRFHSVIFSQISKVPCLVVAYGGNKGQGIMSELGLSNFVIDINEVSSEELCVRFDDLRAKNSEIIDKLDIFFDQIPKSRQRIVTDLKKVFH